MPDARAERLTERRINPSALVQGDEFIVLRVGPVYAPDGKLLKDNVEEVRQLHEMVRFFEGVQEPSCDFPLIDFDHAAVGNPLGFLASPEARLPLGAVVAMRVDEQPTDGGSPALLVTPAWTKHGRTVVDRAEGLLHPSAVYSLAPQHDRATGERVAEAGFFSFGICPRPATRPDQLGAVRGLGAPNDSAASAAPSAPIARRADQEARMGIEEILAALEALSPEDKAAIMEALEEAPADAGDDAGEEARAEAPADPSAASPPDDAIEQAVARAIANHPALKQAEGIVEQHRLAAQKAKENGKLTAMVARGQMSPAEMGTFDKPGIARLALRHEGSLFEDTFGGRRPGSVVNLHAVGTAGSGEVSGPPETRNGFSDYVSRNQVEGEDYDAALKRIGAVYPNVFEQAFGYPLRRKGA